MALKYHQGSLSSILTATLVEVLQLTAKCLVLILTHLSIDSRLSLYGFRQEMMKLSFEMNCKEMESFENTGVRPASVKND